jgi:hypothetical protein
VRADFQSRRNTSSPHWRGWLKLETYITMLPKTDQQLDEWQTAIASLLLVVKLGGPTMFARRCS